MNAEETKRWKAKQLRYKKPIVRDLNLDKIREDLWNIMEECENIRWYTDSDDGNDSLINALDGDEDEAYEFKMAFADLCAECFTTEVTWLLSASSIRFLKSVASIMSSEIIGTLPATMDDTKIENRHYFRRYTRRMKNEYNILPMWNL